MKVVTIALLGRVQTTEQADAVWVTIGEGGVLNGPDGRLNLVRLGPVCVEERKP